MSVDAIHAEIDSQINAHATYESYRDGADGLSHHLAYRVLTVLGIETEPDVVNDMRAEIRSIIERKASNEGWNEHEETDDSYNIPLTETETELSPTLTLIIGDKS